MKINILAFLIILLSTFTLKAQKEKTFTLVSPNQGLIAQIDVSDKIYYSLQVKEQEIILPSSISMTLENGTILGKKPKVKDSYILNGWVFEFFIDNFKFNISNQI